jgi:hypothetical protein
MFGVRSLQEPVRRRYETNCRFCASSYLERCRVHTGSGPTHQPPGKRTPIPEGDQEAAKDVEQGKQEAGKSHEESCEGTTEGDEQSKPAQ